MPLPIADRAPAVLFDVDGTLCDVRSIRHHVDGTGRRNFDAFHAESIDCPPHAPSSRWRRVPASWATASSWCRRATPAGRS
ncbi:hypothetical protein [Agrococcus jejuensis]|uniref:hypothetical protein n=1 Tax=Agrococcus jejuensis TaxID=399736 RepID=UPI000B883625|nr:hypothetical protein [Agrococcus jejuensis]